MSGCPCEGLSPAPSSGLQSHSIFSITRSWSLRDAGTQAAEKRSRGMSLLSSSNKQGSVPQAQPNGTHFKCSFLHFPLPNQSITHCAFSSAKMFLLSSLSISVPQPPFYIQPLSAHAQFNSAPSTQMSLSPGSADSNTFSTAARKIFLRQCFCHIISHLRGLWCLWFPPASYLMNLTLPYFSQRLPLYPSLLASQSLHMLFFHKFIHIRSLI